MKRTFTSRFINVGTLDDKDPIVDKRRWGWGKINDPDVVARQLRGEPDLSAESSPGTYRQRHGRRTTP